MKKLLLVVMLLTLTAVSLTGCKIKMAENSSEKSEDYIIAKSDRDRLKTEDLEGLNENEIKFAKNEIYARHGKIFDDTVFNKYLENKEWYNPNPSYSDGELSEIEKVNIQFIQDYIDKNFTTTEATTTTIAPVTQAVVQQQIVQNTPAPTPAPERVPVPQQKKTNPYASDDYIDSVVGNYICNLIDAINCGNYNLVEDYIVPGSPLETDQIKLVNNLYNKGITESYEGHTCNSIDWIDDNTCTVKVTESEGIYKPDGTSQVKTYNWTYTCKFYNGDFRMYSIK